MATNLKAGEHVTVDRTIEFDATSESSEKGLRSVEAGHVGVVIGRAPQGRATIVEFSGIPAIITNQRLVRAADKPLGKKRGRKKQGVSTSTVTKSSSVEDLHNPSGSAEEEPSLQLVNQIANALLLNGGLKEEDNTVIQLLFADLPDSVQAQLRALIKAKLSLTVAPPKT